MIKEGWSKRILSGFCLNPVYHLGSNLGICVSVSNCAYLFVPLSMYETHATH